MMVRVVALLLLVLVSGSLQGCFPVIAAGVGAGAIMAQDRRGRDAFIEDQKIETAAFERIDKQFNTAMHVNVTSYNHNVLISGEVLDESTRTEIGKIVSDIKNVHDVNNDLAVSNISSLASRSNDGLITTNVKLRFVNDKRFNADHVKVVTENGTVYLLGIVSRAEAEAATDVTSTTQGVQRVISMFEYLD
jgi:osmotically-inducible protein OsmY